MRRSVLLITLATATACGEGRAIPAPGDAPRDAGASGSDGGSGAAGTRGGQCLPNGTCNAALMCTQSICDWIFLDPRNAGAEGGPCRASGERCNIGLECMIDLCGGPEIEPTHVTVEDVGGQLRFGWTFHPKAAFVFVVREDDLSTLVWGVRSQAGLLPPVTFGVAPVGAEVLGSSAPLTAGVAHRVVVLEHEISSSGAATLYETFTP